jgi:hypothetical protein
VGLVCQHRAAAQGFQTMGDLIDLTPGLQLP